MRHFLLAATVALFGLGSANPSRADEGMWPPNQIAALADSLKQRGLEIPPRQLADLAGYPLNAIVGLDFCSAGLVSPEGLIITNHHCVYAALQYNSTAERDLLRKGFLAAALADELPADPSLRVYVTDSIKDVTSAIIGNLSAELDGPTRHAEIEANSRRQIARCESPGGLRCGVNALHGGLKYQLIRQIELRDVRLVYAPASAVGDFGGEIDNFEWPRHAGDYAFLRAYVGPDGKPADYAVNNRPYRPKSWLRIAADGLAEGDFVMVAGYPGSTTRYRLADEVAAAVDREYPAWIALLEELLATIARETTDRPDAAIKYAASVASMNNMLKLFKGTLEGLAKMDAVASKRREEAAVLEWMAAQGRRSGRARAALTDLQAEIASQRSTLQQAFWLSQIGARGLLGTAVWLDRQALEHAQPDGQREAGYQDRDRARNEGELRQFERRFDAQVDRAMLAVRLRGYAALPAGQRVPELDRWLGLVAGQTEVADLDERLAALFANTTLGASEQQLRWFNATAAEIAASGDSMLALARALRPALRRLERREQAREGRLAELRPHWMQAMIEFREAQQQPIYPDANGTLRLSFGQVRGYVAADGVEQGAFTALRGVARKHTGAPPFDAPAAQREAIAAGRGAQYRMQALGDVPVDFLTDLDTTGGSSGSPTLNARGELVGLAFDGNYESIASDWVFNPALTRSIHVDLRYIRWMMACVDGADRLLDEMGLNADAAAQPSGLVRRSEKGRSEEPEPDGRIAEVTPSAASGCLAETADR